MCEFFVSFIPLPQSSTPRPAGAARAYRQLDRARPVVLLQRVPLSQQQRVAGHLTRAQVVRKQTEELLPRTLPATQRRPAVTGQLRSGQPSEVRSGQLSSAQVRSEIRPQSARTVHQTGGFTTERESRRHSTDDGGTSSISDDSRSTLNNANLCHCHQNTKKKKKTSPITLTRSPTPPTQKPVTYTLFRLSSPS